MSVTGKTPISPPLRHNAYSLIAWVFVVAVIAFYARQIVPIGIDLRQDYWVYWTPNHFLANMDEALNHTATRSSTRPSKLPRTSRARKPPNRLPPNRLSPPRRSSCRHDSQARPRSF